MRNKTTTYKWAYLPFVFSSAAILATQASAGGPGSTQQIRDAHQVNRVNHEYVGGRTQIGIGVNDEGDTDIELNQVLSESDNHSTGVGLWAGYDLKGDDKGILGRGVQVNHNWVARDRSGRATHVNKVFAAYDRNEDDHEKATVGYGRENKDIFWEGHVSKGLSGRKDSRIVNGQTVSDRAYDWGVGGSVGKFLPESNVRIRAGLDHEWSDKVGKGEKDARNTTLSAGIEKFFQGTGHSLALDVAGSNRSGGYRNGGSDDSDVTGRLGYRYDFGGASIYQPDRRYRRVRVEVPGKAVTSYKTVPVYAEKTIRTPYKQLVKSTMELEGQTFFKLNSAKLIPSAKARLKQIAAQIRKTGYKGSIRITGNTCGLGDPVYDQRLSERRAKAVRNFLIKNGFNPDHLIARGLGKGHPKYPRTPDQDFKNRRVDIEYVSEQKQYKTKYRTETKKVQTGTRKVALPGKPGAPRVIWKTEAIPTPPAWIKRALHNNIKHDRTVNTYETTEGSGSTPLNSAPNAVNDIAKVGCGEPISINVLGNDTDPDGDTLSVVSFTQPANGTVTRGENGLLIYTSNGDTCGLQDDFTYTITDGNGNTSTATVTVTIDDADKNSAPIAKDDSATTTVGVAVTLDTLANDSDPDGDTLTITSVEDPANGTAVISGGQIIYTPDPGFVGTDTFSYTISDGNGGTATATETVVVTGPSNSPPNANDDTASTACNAITIDVLDNDSDPDGDALSIISVGDASLGTAVISGNTIVYTPSNTCGKGTTGKDTFSYTISDGNGGTATANVTVDVKGATHDGYTDANPDDAMTTVDTPITINVLANDTGKGLKIIAVDDPKNGTAEIINNKIKYTPDPGFVGTESFWYDIVDANGYNDAALIVVYVEKACPVTDKCH